MSWRCLGLLVLVLSACQRSAPSLPSVTPPPSPTLPAAAAVPPKVPLALCEGEGDAPLNAARRLYDAERFEEALSCAAQAAAFEPESADAHAERASALAALGRTPEAQVAFARALALDPLHADALLGASYLFAVQLPSTREHDELGALYAERGLIHFSDNEELLPQFSLLAAMAYNDLGEAHEALERAEGVLLRHPQNAEAAYERALSLFELCRFEEAKLAFTRLVEDPERGPHASQHLGLLLEREGKWRQAQSQFERAQSLAPEDFPLPPAISEEEFALEVARAVGELPADMQQDLVNVPVTAEELPAEADLRSGEFTLSPAILGLFRGPPLREPCDGEGPRCRSIALYRRNLQRAVKTREELLEQIRVTLLHEVGHLRGEDDFELAARGLE